MKNKLISAITAFVICLQIISVSVISYADDTKSNVPAHDVVSLLDSLNIVSVSGDSDTVYDSFVKRGDFAVYALNAVNMGEISYGGASNFVDVISDSPYYSAANTLASMGIVSGNESGSFLPDEYITYNQAVKIIIGVIGYDAIANQYGGWPAGYISAAAKNRLLRGVETADGGLITLGSCMNLIYNSLFADLLKSEGKIFESYVKDPSGNILTEFFDLTMYTGQVTSNGISSFDGKSDKDGYVTIGDKRFAVGNTDAADYLGYHVTVYADSDGVLAYVNPEKSGKEIDISSDDIISYESMKYKYQESDTDSKLHEAVVSKQADIIYNNSYMKYDSARMIPVNGTVKLIDNDSDSKYELVIITDYRNIVVDKVSKDDLLVSDKYGGTPVSFKEENEKHVSLKDKYGNQFDVSKLYEWDVITYLSDADGKYIDAYLTRDYVNGKVTSIDYNKKKVFINKREYNLAYSYPSSGNDRLKSGDNGDFLLDKNGKVTAFVRLDDTKWKWGYLIRQKQKSWNIMLQIFDYTDNAAKEYTAASNVKIDGDRQEDNSALLNLGSTLIRYRTNKNGEVFEIDTPSQGTKEDKYDSLSLSVTSTKMNYRYGAFECKGVIDSDTKVFVVPTDRINLDCYRVGDATYFTNDLEYTVEMYSLSPDNGICDAVICYSDIGSGKLITNHMEPDVGLIEKIELGSDDEGITRELVTMWVRGVKKELYSVSDKFLVSEKKVGVGDVIRYGTDYKNRINDIIFIYDYNEDTCTGEFVGQNYDLMKDYNATYRVIDGYVYFNQNNVIRITKEKPADKNYNLYDLEAHLANLFKIVVYDTSARDNQVRIGTASDLRDYLHYGDECSKVLIQTKNKGALGIIVYK